MTLHYFHCTDGVDLILDRRGKRVRPQRISRTAADIAGSLMSELPETTDWSGWLVNVYDSAGSVVAIVPFVESPASMERAA
jgi:hypothetical protein